MEALKEVFEGFDAVYVTDDSELGHKLTEKYPTFRHVQTFEFNPVQFMRALLQSYHIMREEKPDLIFSSGAQIAIPFFWLSPFFRVRTIFLEVITRVREPTLTGRAVYPFADLFLVQHEEMLPRYGKRAKYAGCVL